MADAHHDHGEMLPPAPDNPATGQIAVVLLVIGVLTLAACIGVVQLFHKHVQELTAEQKYSTPNSVVIATDQAAEMELGKTGEGRVTIDSAMDNVAKDTDLLAPIKAPAK